MGRHKIKSDALSGETLAYTGFQEASVRLRPGRNLVDLLKPLKHYAIRFFKHCFRILVSWVLGGFSVAQAYDWQTRYGGSVELGTTDNFRLLETLETETTVSRLGMFANLSGKSELAELRVDLRANANDYSASTIDDDSSERLAMSARREEERWSGMLSASFDSQSTTESELLDTGNLADGQRETTRIMSNMGFAASEKSRYSAALDTQDVRFDEVNLTAYRVHAITFAWQYQVDETSEIAVSLRRAEFDPRGDADTDIHGGRLAYFWSTRQSTSYNFALGYSDVDRPRDDETGADYTLGVDRQIDDRNQISASWRNSFEASGTGQVRDEDKLSFQWAHARSEKLRLNLVLDALRNDEREFAVIELNGHYQFRREVAFGARLRYRQQNSDNLDAESSSFFLTISYHSI